MKKPDKVGRENFKENFKLKLEKKLAAGEITQEEYDNFISKADEKPAMGMFMGNGKMKGFERREITEEEKASMKEKMTKKLSERLANGEITQEEYDECLKNIEEGKPMMGRPMMDKPMMRGNFEKKELTEEEKSKFEERKNDKGFKKPMGDKGRRDHFKKEK